MSQQENMPERIRFLREAGEVPRFAIYGNHDPSYTLGRQAYNVVNLILLLHPQPSISLIKAAMWLTTTERMTGEISVATREDLGEALMRAEKRITDHFELSPEQTTADRVWLIGCQKLELCLWASEQLAGGNFRCSYLHGQLRSWFSSHPLPPQIHRILELYNPNTRCMDSVPAPRDPSGE